mgnify:CR=1 FL=1
MPVPLDHDKILRYYIDNDNQLHDEETHRRLFLRKNC